MAKYNIMKLKLPTSPLWTALLFVVAMTSIFFLYNYHQIAKYGPVSMHSWRQGDSASIARCYYENGMHFFQPRVHQRLAGKGEAVAEFTGTYYLAAIFYHIFGFKHSILRFLHYLILLFGLFLIYRMLTEELEDSFIALSIPILALSSPLMAFYSFNFIPNPPSLGLSLMGLYCFWKYTKQKDLKWIYLMGGCFMFSGLLKISMLSLYLALFGVGIWGAIFYRDSYKKYFPALKHWFGVFFMIAIGVAAWYVWARLYNVASHSTLFTTEINPVWEMNPEDVRYSMRAITTIEYLHYYPKNTLITFFVLLVISWFLPMKSQPLLRWYLIILSVGTVCFFVVFFNSLLVHNYYIIDIIALPLVTFSVILWWLKAYLPQFFSSWVFKIILIAFVAYNLDYGNDRLDYYYDESSPMMQGFNKSFLKQKELEAFLARNDISYDSNQVVSIADRTPNATLYYLNLRGWTQLFGNRPVDSKIKQLADFGADYLIISRADYLEEEGLDEVLQYPIDTFDQSIYVFDIRMFNK